MLENVDGHIGPRNDFLIFQIAVAIGGAFSGSATSVWVCAVCTVCGAIGGCSAAKLRVSMLSSAIGGGGGAY